MKESTKIKVERINAHRKQMYITCSENCWCWKMEQELIDEEIRNLSNAQKAVREALKELLLAFASALKIDRLVDYISQKLRR